MKTKVRFRLSIKWKDRKAPVKKLNIEQLKNSQITEQYKNGLNDALRTVKEESSIDDIWEKTEKSVKKIAEEVLGFQGKRLINKWFNEECKTEMAKRDNARTIMLRDPSENYSSERQTRLKWIQTKINNNERRRGKFNYR